MPRTVIERARLRTLGPHTRAHVQEILDAEPSLYVSSARRTAAQNRRVGGAPNSYHLRGRAVDLTGALLVLHRAAGLAHAIRVGQSCTGPEEVILEDAGTRNQHLHLAF